jgi:beta-galactosidase
MPRSFISLNGAWSFAPLPTSLPLEVLPVQPAWESQPVLVPSSWRWSFDPEAEYQPYDLFGYPPDWNKVEAGLLRRKFTAARRAGERIWLVFQGILQQSIVFINGQKISKSTESYLPLEIDVTGQVVDGENEVVVWCGPYERVDTPMGSKVIAPCGSWFANLARGIWQDVTLEYHPAVSLCETTVRTSTRQGTIEIEAWVENRSSEAFYGMLSNQVYSADQQEIDLSEQRVTLQAGERIQVILRQAWSGAHRWSPEDPYLYTLCQELVGEGVRVDSQNTRFGFREVWFEGHKLMLNGVRVNLRGDAWHYQGFAMQTKEYALNWYKMCREAGINFVRLHAMPYPGFFLEAADETGMLIVDESAIYGSGKAMQADHPDFIENCRAHLQALTRRDRNHPSVIVWSMQNEMRWVDGREGYLQAIPALTAVIKAMDPTRAVSYDGDNRLVPAEACEIVSMHYNIDGTVLSWDRQKPLIFGEHGAFHYVSPQVSSRFGGPQTYLSFERTMEAIAYQERLFIEYARREEVTGQTPFNTVNYSLWAQPEQAVPLVWPDSDTPGPKPARIPAYSLTVSNGLLPGASMFQPTAAWRQIQAAFRPVTIIADEYDSAFFGGGRLVRHFSIYNDQLAPVSGRVVHSWKVGEQVISEEQISFVQSPGERYAWQAELDLPAVVEKTSLTLSVTLYHGDRLIDLFEWRYTLYPASWKKTPVASGDGVMVLGDGQGLQAIRSLLPAAQMVEALSPEALENVHALVIASRQQLRAEEIQPILDRFVQRGGSILVLEQEQFSLGDLSLTDRSFPMVWMVDPDHPVFTGLTDTDLRFWNGKNPSAPGSGGVSLGAFQKPVDGDLRILLECGDGDFGWGGLLWAPLVEYRVGQGKLVLNQMDICRSFDTVPAACLLLRNLLAYVCGRAGDAHSQESASKLSTETSLWLPAGSKAQNFIQKLGLHVSSKNAISLDAADSAEIRVVDPDTLSLDQAAQHHAFVERGGTLLILPSAPQHAEQLSRLAGVPVQVVEAPVYQLQSTGHSLARGIPVPDLFHIEKVTYTPAGHQNQLICQHALEIPAGEVIFESVSNPWEEFFIHGKDGEYQKIAIATMRKQHPQPRRIYGDVLRVGKGQVVFCQVLPDEQYEKSRRIYTRLLSNLGAEIETFLLTIVREKQDHAIKAWMGLPKETYQDAAAMEAYFSDPGYILNNLGEGVYGWMKRLERRDGTVMIPDSAGGTWFLSAFVESDINRDPTRRATNELPDSSIVPDLFMTINCAYRVYVNGRLVSQGEGHGEVIRVQDVLLSQGLNRLIMVCLGGPEDIRFNAWFLNKYGDPPSGLHYRLTVD